MKTIKMSTLQKLTAVTMVIAIILCSVITVGAIEKPPQIKNIIYMIPDGGAMASFFLADHVKQAGGIDEKFTNATPTNAERMYLKDYLVGAETTHSANSEVTDSAASGTALSSAYKTNNSMIGITPEKKPRANILEACQELGKNTGIVVTYEWTNATPAAFSAHAEKREDTLIIGEQIVNQGIDVVFGNTVSAYENQEWFTDESFENRGYKVIRNKTQLNNIKPGDRVWGKLPAAYYDYQRASTTPNLSELTAAAIKALDDGNRNGFFLMVEGSAVDGGGHNSDAMKMVSEWLAFDEACKVAIEYAKKRNDTLVMIMPDHDSGGIKYGSDYTSESLKPLVSKIQDGENPSDVTWEGNKGHTGRNGGIFMYVPDGVPYPDGIDKSKADDVLSAFESDFRTCDINRIDNTDITKYLSGLLGVSLDDMTDKLFVDVTNRGTYDSGTEIFSFKLDTGETVEIERNTSQAKIDDEDVSLLGQVAVYVGEKFYVPEILLNGIPEQENPISIYADYSNKMVRIEGLTPKSFDDVTVVITEPGKSLLESTIEEKFSYIGQEKSDTNGFYEMNIKILEGEIGDYTYYTRIKSRDNVEEYNFSFKNMAIEKNGVAVENISEVVSGDCIRLALNGYDSDFDGLAVIAQYGNDNEIVDVKVEPIKGSAVAFDDEDYIETTVKDNVKVIKGFYWNRITYAPFTGVYTVD